MPTPFRALIADLPTSRPRADRRGMLGLMGTVVAASFVAAPNIALADGADADLIAVASALENAYRRLDAWDRDLVELNEEESGHLSRATRAIGKQLASMRPSTREGMRAKARAIRWMMDAEVCKRPGQTVEAAGLHHERLAWSLINDVLEGVAA